MNDIIWPSQMGRLPRNVRTSSYRAGRSRLTQLSAWREPYAAENGRMAKMGYGAASDSLAVLARYRKSRSHCSGGACNTSANKEPAVVHSKSTQYPRNDASAHYFLPNLGFAQSNIAQLGIRLTPNHHLAMHYDIIIKQFSPMYVTWLFPFERFNLILEQCNNNGHASGVMELTVLRNWIKKHRLHELVSFSGAKNATLILFQ